jgi:SAM-dependent methyltransferase
MFRHRAERSAAAAVTTPTTVRALEALPEGGTVLDVGVGGGATSLPLAGRAGTIVGVDGQADMLEAFEAAAAAAGVASRTMFGAWPDVAPEVDAADVVICGHVLYNVQVLEPFARALDAHARRRVVAELTARHPLAWMDDLWLRFHGLSRPAGPTADDAEEALRELGLELRREQRIDRDERGGGFVRREDAVALVRRRLCLPADRDGEIGDALGDRLRETDGRWSAGPADQPIVTLWWDRAPAR